MSAIDPQTMTQWMQTLLEETFAKTAGQPGYMLDRSALGLLGTLEALSAEAASTSVSPETTSIAAQAFHIAFIQDAFIHWLQGQDLKPDWSQSWPANSEMNAAEWQALRENLQRQHQELKSLLDKPQAQDPLENAALLIAHSAYHLGSIRQISRSLNLI